MGSEITHHIKCDVCGASDTTKSPEIPDKWFECTLGIWNRKDGVWRPFDKNYSVCNACINGRGMSSGDQTKARENTFLTFFKKWMQRK